MQLTEMRGQNKRKKKKKKKNLPAIVEAIVEAIVKVKAKVMEAKVVVIAAAIVVARRVPVQVPIQIHSDSNSDSGDEKDIKDIFVSQDMNKLRALWKRTKGILYESEAVQIGYKCEIEDGNKINIGLFFGNKNKKKAFKSLKTAIETNGFVNARVSPETINIPPNKQIKQNLTIESKKPFVNSPVLSLSFKYGGQPAKLRLEVPILVTHFITPNDIPSANFLPSWTGIGNPVQKQLKMVSVEIQQIMNDFKNLHLHVCTGVDTNVNISVQLEYSIPSKITSKCRLMSGWRPDQISI